MDRSVRDIKEYDRFGPWVFEISEDDPIPPLFLPFTEISTPSVLSFKVPRPIERRQASPGMDLYDYLITLREDSIEILHRQGNKVTKRTATYRDILAIRCSQDLLRGTVSLITGDKIYDFPFNTVSEELIDRMIHILLDKFPKLETSCELKEEVRADEKKLGLHFSRLLNKERREEPQQRCFGAQGQNSVTSRGYFLLKRLWYGIIDKRTFESLHFSDGQRLKIVGRGPLYRYRGTVEYRVDKVYIPLASLTGIDWEPDARQQDVMILKYKVEQNSFAFALSVDNVEIESYLYILRSLNQ